MSPAPKIKISEFGIQETAPFVKVAYRPDTTDHECLIEVLHRRVYRHTNVTVPNTFRPIEGVHFPHTPSKSEFTWEAVGSRHGPSMFTPPPGKRKPHKTEAKPFDVERGEHWLDLGANIGAFAIYCYLRGATATCYEPDSGCYDILMRNLRTLNSTLSKSYPYRFTAIKSAVSARKEPTLQFSKGRRPNDHYRASILPSNTPHPEGHLPNTLISKIVTPDGSHLPKGQTPKKYRWDGIKMDIEGAEFGIIESGMIPSCNKLVMEYHSSHDKSMKNFHRRMDLLRDMFHSVYYMPSMNQDYPGDVFPGKFDRLIHCWGRR